MESHSISVIIPTLNEEEFLPKLLKDLAEQTIQVDEILVVDGGSTDKTLQFAKKFSGVETLTTKAGTAHQRNFGAVDSKGTHILFLDADVRLNTKFIEQLIEHKESSASDIICPWYIPLNGSLGSKIIMTFFSFVFWLTQKFQASGAGPCIFVSRKIYQKVAGFDENITHDDIAFIRKSSKYGKFSIAPIICNISDRRFIKEGVWNIFFKYLLLGRFFLFNDFQGADQITYDMSKDRYRKE